MKHKAITRDISNEDLTEAMGELKDSASKLLVSMGQLAKEVNWKKVAPKLIIALIVLYGIRNQKVIRSIVGSMAVGAISDKLLNTDMGRKAKAMVAAA